MSKSENQRPYNLRPYLIRALIDWVVDNDWTPYLAIASDAPGVNVPAEYVVDGKLVLDVSAAATRNLRIDDRHLAVDCRFAARPEHIEVPVGSVIAVYAQENGMGMSFSVERAPEDETPAEAPDPNKPPSPPRGRAALKLVK